MFYFYNWPFLGGNINRYYVFRISVELLQQSSVLYLSQVSYTVIKTKNEGIKD